MHTMSAAAMKGVATFLSDKHKLAGEWDGDKYIDYIVQRLEAALK
jgi:hypothetical protein